MALLKQSTARTRTFLMVDSTDHLTGKTGLTVTLTLSKNGGAFGAAGGAVSEISSGWYSVALNTTDTNTLGDLAYHATGTGADPSDWADDVLVDLPGGAVSSVTGAVGSVTGNVGGNVVGSVASVTARVTANTDQLAGQTVTAAAGVTFPTSVASPTNITAGTITTATNVTTVNGLAANVVTAASIADAAIDRATFAADTGLQTVRSNTAQAGAGSTITLDASASATDSIYNGLAVYLTGATGAGQVRVITGYVGATKVATVDRAWQTNPDATSTFALKPVDNPKTNSSLEVVSASVTGAVGSVSGAVGSVTAGVTVTTNNDKTGYTLTVTPPTAATISTTVWDELTATARTAGTYGQLLKDDINATISSRMASYTQPTGFLAATFPAGTVANTTNITAGTVTTATNVTNVSAGGIVAASFGVSAIDAAALATDAVTEIAAGVLGAAVEGTTTVVKSLRLHNSALGGKSTGNDTGSPIYRNLADTKDVITATTDANGNRSAVTTDLT